MVIKRSEDVLYLGTIYILEINTVGELLKQAEALDIYIADPGRAEAAGATALGANVDAVSIKVVRPVML